MPFIIFDHINNINTLFFQGFNDLVRFQFIHTGIIGPLSDEHRDFDLISMEKRRRSFQQIEIPANSMLSGFLKKSSIGIRRGICTLGEHPRIRMLKIV